ncbi:hypothetical protein A2110_01050 [Candidatus Jorgensenbacteria bacterium GWA1_54_12]|uniref:DUF192 domain-containing protein n=1 Tax=Candidatus Jorgensenbacteria bacterium GWA1_54_12 TaxID=1798468 RepID=A0A1F6BIS4_9BACT|nr:MAG: hypothetical protein A2110_01050 [Candidatus Jorgensenbacteria bacterium GWA1_54_12]
MFLKTNFILLGAVALFLFAGGAVLFIFGWKSRAPYPARLAIQDAFIELIPAVTAAEKMRGLSGRAELPENHGMLFVYNRPGRYGFWMKDMRFPIDIIWLSKGFTIVDITPHISPDSFPKVFRPKEPAQYVLEVNADFAEKHHLSIGDSLKPIY